MNEYELCSVPHVVQVPSCYEVTTWDLSKKQRTRREGSCWKWLRNLCRL